MSDNFTESYMIDQLTRARVGQVSSDQTKSRDASNFAIGEYAMQ